MTINRLQYHTKMIYTRDENSSYVTVTGKILMKQTLFVLFSASCKTSNAHVGLMSAI